MLKNILAIAAFSLLFVTNAIAGPFDDALHANYERNYAKAYAILVSCVERDEGGCQWLLGAYYETGVHVSADIVLAYKWYALAPNARRNAMSISAEARDRIAKLMTPAELQRARELIRQWQAEKRPKKR